ncbi:MAG: extracellular solute-binding protein [Limisphaerales bacterium]
MHCPPLHALPTPPAHPTKGRVAEAIAGPGWRKSLPWAVALALGLVVGCDRRESGPGRVVLYTSLNEPTARPVIDAFEARTGIRVDLRSDTERDKTIGLVQTLLAERGRPRADVFWNSETAQTIRLKQEGILEAFDPPPATAARIPAHYRDSENVWFGFAARARVLIVNTNLVRPDEMPTSIHDLVDPRWRGRAALVRPVTGTTLTHLTALFETLGESAANAFLDGVRDNECALPPGNGRLAQLVGLGQIHFGLTDSSDYRLVRAEGHPVTAVYPDQQGIGTLVIPNTVALIRGGPHPVEARRLIEFLLSDEAETLLARHTRGHIPLKPGIIRPADVLVPGEFKTMEVDFDVVGARIADRLRELDARFP